MRTGYSDATIAFGTLNDPVVGSGSFISFVHFRWLVYAKSLGPSTGGSGPGSCDLFPHRVHSERT